MHRLVFGVTKMSLLQQSVSNSFLRSVTGSTTFLVPKMTSLTFYPYLFHYSLPSVVSYSISYTFPSGETKTQSQIRFTMFFVNQFSHQRSGKTTGDLGKKYILNTSFVFSSRREHLRSQVQGSRVQVEGETRVRVRVSSRSPSDLLGGD